MSFIIRDRNLPDCTRSHVATVVETVDLGMQLNSHSGKYKPTAVLVYAIDESRSWADEHGNETSVPFTFNLWFNPASTDHRSNLAKFLEQAFGEDLKHGLDVDSLKGRPFRVSFKATTNAKTGRAMAKPTSFARAEPGDSFTPDLSNYIPYLERRAKYENNREDNEGQQYDAEEDMIA